MKTTVNDDSLKNSLMISGFLHLLFMLFLYFGLPQIFKPLPSHHDPVPFEIVELADITNTRVKEPEERPQPPQPQAKPQPPAPAQQQQPQPQPPKPQPPQPKEAEPTPQAEAIKPKPVEKIKPKETPQPQQDMLASVLKNVAKLKPAEQVKTPDTKADAKQPAQEAKSMAPSLSNRLTITEEDLLRRQIGGCWNMPIGARDAQNLIVEVMIDVNPDRTVQHAEVVDQNRMASDGFFRAAAESALRALRDPRCTPLALPADKYEQWKRIDFTFDPRDIQ